MRESETHIIRRLHLCAAICVLLVVFLSCVPHTSFGPGPGEAEGAVRGYEACAPLIAALEEYHEVNGSYPDSVDALVPGYLDVVPGEVSGDPIIYT
jgi:hypothetical protein